MNFKIRTKLVVFSTLLYSALLIILGFLAIYDSYKSIVEVYDAKLSNYFDLLEQDLETEITASDDFNFKSFQPNKYKGPEQVGIEIYNSNFELLSMPDSNLADDEIREYFFDKDYNRIYDLGNEERHYYFNIREKIVAGDTIYIAGAIAATHMDFSYYAHKLFIIALIPIAIIIITIISFSVSKLAFKPVKRMVRDVNLIRAGNTSNRISVPIPNDEIKELGETLNKMLDSIEESMISQKKFVENASHEIKTPLTIIRAKLEMLSQITSDEKAKDELNGLQTEIDRLAQLSKSLLTLVRLDSNSLTSPIKTIRLDEKIIETTKSFRFAAEKKQIKLLPVINEVLEIEGSEDQLKSLLTNLIDNAVKYSEENCEVKIVLDKEKDGVLIIVEDEGMGISKKDLPNIFNRFYRSDEVRSNIYGSGLGLSIVEEIIKQHKGSISIDSELGEGTKIRVYLPFKQT